MKIRQFAGGCVLGVAATIAVGTAMPQQGHGSERKSPAAQPTQQQPQAPSDEQMAQMMKAWMDALTPGEPHKQLAESVGAWSTTTRVWMAGPDGPPTETQGSAEFKSVLGGRFVLETTTFQMAMPDMKTGAMKMVPVEGMGLLGYDNYAKMYVGCWADTMNTHLLAMRGSMSPDGKTLTMYGEMDEPMLGIRGRTLRYQTQHLGPDHMVFTITDLHAGENYKVVEIEYRRKK